MLTNIILALAFFQAPFVTPTPDQIAIMKKASVARAEAMLRKIQPHPADPEHFQSVLFDVTFRERHKFLWLTKYEPLSGKVRIEQKRTKDGFYFCGTFYLGVNGDLYGRVNIDPTLRDPTDILFIVLNSDGTEYRHIEITVSSEDLKKGITIQKLIVF